ncbi:MAG TPA: hypothetical protein VF487_12510 [Chitinophagaceae bacterium]
MTHEIRWHTPSTLPAQSSKKCVKAGPQIALFDTPNDTQIWQLSNRRNVIINEYYESFQKDSLSHFLTVLSTKQIKTREQVTMLAEPDCKACSLSFNFLTLKTATL